MTSEFMLLFQQLISILITLLLMITPFLIRWLEGINDEKKDK